MSIKQKSIAESWHQTISETLHGNNNVELNMSLHGTKTSRAKRKKWKHWMAGKSMT